jgi:anti-sigma regulatory factor (Ser/Thr protein kinase)
MAAVFSVQMPPKLEEIARLAESIDRWCSDAGVPAKTAYEINLMLDELITNTVSYGFADGRHGQIWVRIELVADGELQITLTDDAPPFNPIKLDDPDVGADIEHRRIGGLGIYFVKQLSERIEYSDLGNGNELRLLKRFERTPPPPLAA